MPQATVVLTCRQRGNLRIENLRQITAHGVVFRQIDQFEEVRDHNGEPAVATRPAGMGKVMVAVIVPAVEPQPGLPVHQVLHMQQELVHRLLNVFRFVQQLANFGQRQDRHHQRVIPHLLRVLFRQGYVLHAAVFGTRHLMHRPLRPALQPRQPGRISGLFVAVRQRQERRHGIYVFGGCPFRKTVRKPAVDNVAHSVVAGLAVVLPDTVQPDAVRPLPPCPAFGIYDAPVVQPQQKFTRFVVDIDQVMRHLLNQRFQLVPGDKTLWLTQQGAMFDRPNFHHLNLCYMSNSVPHVPSAKGPLVYCD